MSNSSVAHLPENQIRPLLMGLTGLYLLFVIYGSLVPLHYVAIPFEQALDRFLQMPFLDLGIASRADWVANLLLFIPLSFLWGQLALPQRSASTRHLLRLIIVAACFALACGIEFTQTFFPQRTVSQNDILAESLGAVIGLILQATHGNSLHKFLAAFWRKESQGSRIQRLLHAYLVGLLIFNVLPLDLTLSPVELYHKWMEGRVVLVPFGGHYESLSGALYETFTDLILWIPAGILWTLAPHAQIRQAVIKGFGASLLIELAQCFVYSRVTDVTDILLAVVGCLLGGLIGRHFQSGKARTGGSQPGYYGLLWVVWVIATLGIFWFPFDFQVDRSKLADAFQNLLRVPFVTYYYGTEFHATNELLRKIGLFLPGGILWALAAGAGNTARWRRTYWSGSLMMGALALTLEIGQTYLPGKTADITDALLEWIGCLLGLSIARWIRPTSAQSSIRTTNTDQRRAASMPASPASTSTTWLYPVGTIALLGLAVWIATRLSFVPYNIRELLPSGPYESALSALGLAGAIYWFTEMRPLLHAWSKPRAALILPLILAAHGSVSWILLRLSVPLESLHDIVGSPVLGWPWEWEMIGRYIGLHAALILQQIGGILLVAFFHKQVRLERLLLWLSWSLLLAWPLYSITIDNAATDNLTELIRDNGSLFNSSLIALGLLAFFVCSSLFSRSLSYRQFKASSIILMLLSATLSAACFWLGSEPMLNKYGQIFSAGQFLLSADRSHYVGGQELAGRYALAYALAVLLVAVGQMRYWQTRQKKAIRPN